MFGMVPLSPGTATFLRTCVRSQLQMDILLLLCRDDERWWNAAQLAVELSVPEETVFDALEQLAATNLLDVRIGAALAYRFAPVDDAARAAMREAAARPYDAREVVAHAARRSRAAERFADAFRIRRSNG